MPDFSFKVEGALHLGEGQHEKQRYLPVWSTVAWGIRETDYSSVGLFSTHTHNPEAEPPQPDQKI